MMKENVILQFLITIVFLLHLSRVSANEPTKPLKNLEDENGDDFESRESMSIAEPQNQTVCTRRQGNSMHEIQSATTGQFPFVVAVMSQKNDYLCSGTIVSDGLILTTSVCASRAVGYVLLNATRDRKEEHTHSYAVIDVEKFPTHTGPNPAKEVALLHTERFNSTHDDYRIKISNYTIPQDIVFVEAFGYGLNAEVGQPKELQYVGLEVREPFTTLFLYAYFDCVETKVLTCFKDTGGPVIVTDELIGVVRYGQEKCTKEISSQYMINKNMVEIMPVFLFRSWLDEKIKKNEEQGTDMVIMKTSGRRTSEDGTSAHKNGTAASSSNNGHNTETELGKNQSFILAKIHKEFVTHHHSSGCSIALNLFLFSITLITDF